MDVKVFGTVDVVALSDNEWRVSDHRIPESEGRSLIGYIQKVGELFEATRLDSPWERSYFQSLEAAVADLQTEGKRRRH